MTRVLINGIDGRLGARVAELLSADPEVTLIGLGQTTPPAPIGRAELLKARLSGPQLVELLRAEAVETVIQLAFAGAEGPAAGREETVQQNVLGSMLLLGACAAAGVKRVVLRSHTAVYGASPLNPAFINEDRVVTSVGARGLVRDFVEVEQFVAEFSVRHPQMAIVPLRCAPLIGGWSPMIDYLKQPGPRMLTGFDPCLQLLHLEDAATAFALAACADVTGPINLAASDTLCLSQVIKLAGQSPAALPEPMIGMALTLGNHDILGAWPFDLSFLRHSCLADTRRARCELGWAPAHSAAESLRLLRANGRAEPSGEQAEQALRAFLERKR
jgi:UDP-glucose 4-epimerase